MHIDEIQVDEGGIFGTDFWPRFYDSAATMFRDDPFPFLNLGLLEADRDPVELESADLAETLSARLYERTLRGIGLDGRTVVEVGCGRGGGCAHIAAGHPTAEATGIDRSAELVRWCDGRYRLPNLRFRVGDAEALPLGDDSADVVVNVESSHCYDSRPAFFREVARVLRPGGWLAIADILFAGREHSTAPEVEAALREAGLEILSASELTEDVLRARRAVSRSTAFQARIDAALPRKQAADLLRTLLCMEGSPGYRDLQSGRFRYWRWTAFLPEP